MRVAIIVILVGLGTVLFHVLSPWWWTPIASNWGFIDDTINITFWITGIAFLAVVLFLGYCLFRYRHREGSRAAYEPENQKLEVWLTVGTAVGVIALLTPGLFAWAEYVSPPDDAMEVEALGEQWRWSYRHPGEDGVFGRSDPRAFAPDNPFGLVQDDPNAQDDRLIASNALYLPLDQPVKMLLRSKDVLHNFYVPQFRAKMDLVPGMVTNFWVTPTRTGEFEILCAELCGTGHYAMRGTVRVVEAADYREWLSDQPTLAEMTGAATARAGAAADEADGEDADPVETGRQVAQDYGCLACHSLDGSRGVGPTWQGVWGTEEALADGSTVTVDAAYIRESILQPQAKVTEGFQPIMPPFQLGDAEIDAVVALIESLSQE